MKRLTKLAAFLVALMMAFASCDIEDWLEEDSESSSSSGNSGTSSTQTGTSTLTVPSMRGVYKGTIFEGYGDYYAGVKTYIDFTNKYVYTPNTKNGKLTGTYTKASFNYSNGTITSAGYTGTNGAEYIRSYNGKILLLSETFTSSAGTELSGSTFASSYTVTTSSGTAYTETTKLTFNSNGTAGIVIESSGSSKSYSGTWTNRNGFVKIVSDGGLIAASDENSNRVSMGIYIYDGSLLYLVMQELTKYTGSLPATTN